MIPTKITTHETDAPEFLTSQFRDKAVTSALARVAARRIQKLEDAVFAAMDAFLIDSAAGVQLEALGAIVGEPRNARLDAAYRTAIKVRIRVNRSQGRAIDVIQVARLLDPTATYLEMFPLGWEVEFYNTTSGGDYARLLSQTKAVASYGVVLTAPWPSSETSVFEDSGDASPEDVFDSAT